MSLNPKKEMYPTSLISLVRSPTFVRPTKSTITGALTIILAIALMAVLSPIIIFINSGLATGSAPPLPTISTIHSAPSTISQDGGDFTTQAMLGSLTARPTNNIVNTNSFYDVVFLTASSGAIKTIEVTFPHGTTIPSGAYFNEAEGIGPGIPSKSGQTITYTAANPVNVPAGTKIRLEFANINNPLQVSASYTVTVTTRDAANAIIDGPSESTAYTIKQIGTNAIADGAITGDKIAGTNKLVFGVCTGAVGALTPGDSLSISCLDSNVATDDEIIGFWSIAREDPAPVLINGLTITGAVVFGFANTRSVNTVAQSTVEISYIIFKE